MFLTFSKNLNDKVVVIAFLLSFFLVTPIFQASAMNFVQKAEEYNRQAMEYAKKNDLENAEKYFRKAMDTDPLKLVYGYNLGVVYSMMKDYDKEMDVYDEVIATSIKQNDVNIKINVLSDIYFNMACLYLKKSGDKVKALESLDIAVDKYYTAKLLKSMESDADLDSIREEERFKEALIKLKHIMAEVDQYKWFDRVVD